MFYLNDAVFGYDNNNTVQGVVDDLNEALQDSIKYFKDSYGNHKDPTVWM